MSLLLENGTLQDLQDDGLVIPSRLVDAREVGLDAKRFGPKIMRHERVHFVSYVYEWPFSMLKDAALLTLDLVTRLLKQDLILKDANPFNIMSYKNGLLLIDVLSIDRYAGGPWIGYTQFCRTMLFPLLLAKHKAADFRALLRGRLEGITASETRRLLGFWGCLRHGVFTHVFLQAALERRFADAGLSRHGSDSVTKAMPKTALIRMISKLRAVVEGLGRGENTTHWLSYAEDNTYEQEDTAGKKDFVERFLESRQLDSVVDLGANTGNFSKLAAKHAALVISADVDGACMDSLYKTLRKGSVDNVVPIVCNLLDPSPALGWNLSERRPLFERLPGDGFFALALVHHLCIGGNIPLPAFVDMLARVGWCGVVEWVDKKDEMVGTLLRNREDIFPDYTWESFQDALRERFKIVEVLEIKGGNRKLCHIERPPGMASEGR